jgi:hypothetical protein
VSTKSTVTRRRRIIRLTEIEGQGECQNANTPPREVHGRVVIVTRIVLVNPLATPASTPRLPVKKPLQSRNPFCFHQGSVDEAEETEDGGAVAPFDGEDGLDGVCGGKSTGTDEVGPVPSRYFIQYSPLPGIPAEI